MTRRCFFCHRPFAGNPVVERFPIGRRIAFDPARGRLWAVCPSCRRWSLAPIEERWEALEELERLARDRGRLRASTPNVGLLQTGAVELVRIGGGVGLREESHWRYAREFAARRRRAELVDRVGQAFDAVTTAIVMGVSTLAFGVPMDPEPDPDKWLRWLRTRRFGRRAWAGEAACSSCGEPLPAVSFEERGALLLEPCEPGHRLRRTCPSCGRGPESGAVLHGLAAEQALRRVLAYENYAGATTATIGDAVALVTAAGTPPTFLAEISRRRLVLGRIPRRLSVALEIALADRDEQVLLAMEAAALERRWREEEALAAIIDGELTPLPRARHSTP